MARTITGTIERRGGKPVYIRLTIPGIGRKRIPLPAGCSEAMAEERRLFWSDQARSGKIAEQAEEPTCETIGKYADRWLEERARRGLAKQSTDAYRLRTYVVSPLGEDKPIDQIGVEDVRAIVEHIDEAVRAETISWKTAKNAWGLASKLFADMASSKVRALRVRETNPAIGVRGPDRGVVRGSSYLFPIEAVQLLSCTDVPMARRVVYALAIYTGLRLGELRGLRVGDVVLAGGYLSVARSHSLGANEKSTKGKRVRRVPLELAARPLLEALTRNRPAAEHVLPPGINWQDLPGNLRRDLLAAGVDRAELHLSHESRRQGSALRRPINLHDLRHTYATWLALRGEGELVIQSRLGHTDTATTRRYIAAAEEVGQGDVGAPFFALPEPVVAVEVSTAIVHPRSKAPKTGLILRTRRDSNPRYPCGYT